MNTRVTNVLKTWLFHRAFSKDAEETRSNTNWGEAERQMRQSCRLLRSRFVTEIQNSFLQAGHHSASQTQPHTRAVGWLDRGTSCTRTLIAACSLNFYFRTSLSLLFHTCFWFSHAADCLTACFPPFY